MEYFGQRGRLAKRTRRPIVSSLWMRIYRSNILKVVVMILVKDMVVKATPMAIFSCLLLAFLLLMMNMAVVVDDDDVGVDGCGCCS